MTYQSIQNFPIGIMAKKKNYFLKKRSQNYLIPLWVILQQYDFHCYTAFFYSQVY